MQIDATTGDAIFSKKELERIIKKHPDLIETIENPPEELQILVVNEDPYCIEYIKNPTDEVQCTVVREVPNIIYYIRKPTRGAIIEYIKCEHNLPRFKNKKLLTDDILEEAIEINWQIIGDIDKPSDKLQIKAFQIAGQEVFNFIQPREVSKKLETLRVYV